MALGLIRESFGPRVELLGWSERGPATGEEREEIARLAISRANGSDVVLAPTGAAIEAPLPDELAPIGIARGFGLQFVGTSLALLAGRGRGRALAVKTGDLAAAREIARRLAEPEPRAELGRLVVSAAELLARSLVPPRGRLHELDGGPLLPVLAKSRRAFGYALDIGGELSLEPAANLGQACFGVLVRGRESFELSLRAGGRLLDRSHLVLVRRLADADRGAVLRVELDDEDLGPWRLGERGAVDTFSIPSDLLAGRERVRVAVTPEEGREVASLSWRFAVEPELDGIGLTELEPSEISGRIGPRDRALSGELLRAGRRAFLHGLELAPQSGVAEATWSLPSGYRRLDLGAAPGRDGRDPGDEPRPAALLEIALDGTTAATLELAFESPQFARVLVGAARALTLRVRGAAGARVLLLDPALLR